MRPSLALSLCLLSASVAAQDISQERVLDVLGYLASDDLAGRDSPSRGQDLAAEFLAERFAAAGLKPGGDGDSFFHGYELPGRQQPEAQIELAWGGRSRIAGEDFRLWRVGRALSGESVTCQVLAPAAAAQVLRAARKPILVPVPKGGVLWNAARDAQLRGRGVGQPVPVFLVDEEQLDGVEGDLEVQLSMPEAVEAPIPLRNVVGVLPGAERPEEVIVVSAHYDHVGVRLTGGEDFVFNGTDDDATGTTAVVLLAEHLAAREQRPARTVVFVAFSAEEKGLRGSAAFVEDEVVPLERIVANLNIEMLGRPTPETRMEAWITGRGFSDFAAAITPALEESGLELVDFEMQDRLFFASDNASFARAGVIAHTLSAGHLHEDYHQPGDEIDRAEIEHMTVVIQGLAAALAEIADGDQAFQFNEAGKAAMDRGRRRR